MLTSWRALGRVLGSGLYRPVARKRFGPSGRGREAHRLPLVESICARHCAAESISAFEIRAESRQGRAVRECVRPSEVSGGGRSCISCVGAQKRKFRVIWAPLVGEIGPPECPWAGGRQHGRPVAARYRLGRPLPPPRPPPASRTLARGDFPRISGSRDSSCPRARPAGWPTEAR